MNHFIKLTLVILFLTTGFYASAQKNSAADSTVVSKIVEEHSPRKATIYSAVLPGLGQIYNKTAWKVPIIYAGFAACGYLIDWNNDQYVLYKQAYADIIDDDPNTISYEELNVDNYWDFDNANHVSQFTTRLYNAKEGARRYRDMWIMITVGVYALNIIEASVNAHFFNFDISDDISLNWTPTPGYCFNQPTMGVQLNMRF